MPSPWLVVGRLSFGDQNMEEVHEIQVLAYSGQQPVRIHNEYTYRQVFLLFLQWTAGPEREVLTCLSMTVARAIVE